MSYCVVSYRMGLSYYAPPTMCNVDVLRSGGEG